MSMDYRIPDPNKKITDKLVLDFARKSFDEDKNNSLQFFVTMETHTRFLSPSKMKKLVKSPRGKKLFLVKHLRPL